MAITVKHNKVSLIPDAGDDSLIEPSDWNADHTLTGLGTAAELDAGVPNGVATLDAGGKVPITELPAAVLGALNYQGTWDASTNTPTLTSSVGTKGYYYVVSVAGNTNLNGVTDWLVGDWAVYNGTVWQKVDNTDAGGDVVGPASATDNAIARFDTTTGKLIQNSIVTVSDTGAISGVIQENFTPVTAPAYAEGRVFYDTDAKTLCYYNDNTQMTVNIGQENIVRVRNQTGANLTNGTVVYITGATGNTPTVAKAIATSFATADIIGVLTTDIANNGFGYATTTGLVNGLDTSAFVEGDAVFLSATTAGTFTTVEPARPNYSIQVGVILRANPSVGTLLVAIQVISTENIHIIGTLAVDQGGTGQTSYTDGQLLIGNTTGNTLTKSTLTAGTAIGITNGAGSISIANTGVTSAVAGTGISVSGATGAVTIANTGVLSVSGTTGRITSTGGATPALDLTSGIVTAGTTGSSTLIPVITVDTYGRVTSVTTAANPQGTVTSVTGTSPVVSSGGATPAISLAANYGDTLNPYASKTANNFLAAPNGIAGAPTFRAIVAADIPTLNQNTTGTASNVTGTVAIANGGTGATTAATARTNLGATTVGGNFFTLANPTAITFPRINADNTVSALDAATYRTAIGAGTGSGTVTSVGGTGTVNGITLTGTVTSTGNLTLGGTLSGVSLTTQVTGTLPIANGGTGATTRQDAMDALAGAVTSGQYLRGNGTDVVMSAIQAADVPTLNQNTTGNAATATTATNQSGGTVNATTGAFSGITNITNATVSTNSSTGALVVTGGLGIGGVTNVNNIVNRITGSGNSAWLQQDGTGRVHWYWNTYGGASPTFTNANEDASALTLHITGSGAGGSFFHRSASGVGQAAGAPITWTTTVYSDLNTFSWKGNTVLRSDNYNSFAPTLTGTGASGTWGISVTGNAATATSATSLNGGNYISAGSMSGNWNTDFQNTPAYSYRYNGDDAGGTNNPGGTWWFHEEMRHSNASNYWGTQIAWGWEDNANRLATRNVSGGTFGAWVYYLNSSNFTTYAPSLTGSGASGTWNINITGTATTATNQSGGTVSATTGSFSGQLSVAQSTSLINNGINLNAAGNGFLRGTANDASSSTQANVQLMSWQGIGFSPSITGQAVPQGENAVWINARNGDITARGLVTSQGAFAATSAAPFYLNATTVSANYTIPANFNASSAGPITINTGVTVTVSTGSTWVVV